MYQISIDLHIDTSPSESHLDEIRRDKTRSERNWFSPLISSIRTCSSALYYLSMYNECHKLTGRSKDGIKKTNCNSHVLDPQSSCSLIGNKADQLVPY